MQKLHSQHGFTTLDLVLLGLLVIAIGAAAYFAFSNRHGANVATLRTSARGVTTPSPSSKPQTTPSATPSPTPNITYLTITQFGVKFPISSGLSDITYVYQAPDSSSNDSGIVKFDATDICPGDPGALGSLVRYNTPITNASQGEQVFHIGSYYYVDGGVQDACSSDDTVANSEFAKIKLLLNALAGLQSI